MGEENTSSHHVHQPKLGLKSAQAILGSALGRLLLDNFYTEEVIGITVKALVTVGRNLVLPLSLCDRGADIVRVQAAMRSDVINTDDGAILDIRERSDLVPCVGAVDLHTVGIHGLSLVLQEPQVVLVLVGVQGDLLLLAAGGVHKGVRVEVATLGVKMADCDTAAHQDVGGHILHALGVQGGLELGAHETISLAGVHQAQEVDGEHAHVDTRGDHDETDSASQEMLVEGFLQ